MTALLLDVGNTRLKWGLLEDGEIRRTGHLAQARMREQGLQVLTTRLPRKIDSVLASNVAGNRFATRLSGVVGAHCGCDVHFARTERAGWGVTNSYAQPRRMGVDRWVAMIGARAELGKACLVVDAGTAVTIDALDDDGQHLGGQIIAGAATMANALASATSDIPAIKPGTGQTEAGLDMFGNSTARAVRKGAHNAIAGAIERAFRALQDSGYRPALVLTGGDSSRILGALCETPLHRPHLVLQGLAHILETPR